MQIGDKLKYLGKEAEVVDKNLTHVLIKFVDGSKLCTTKTTFDKDYK